MEKGITRLFCLVDDFLKALEKERKKNQDRVHRYLMSRGLKIITGIKRTMKNILMSFEEKILLRKRSLVETVFDNLKNKFMLEHSRHRSFINMLVHIIFTLTAYQSKPSKPSVAFYLLGV
ncbi:MAG: transposase [Alphaproteobacteria bacterium]|nr:transposase [Alphaproteobacteria bacterium]